MRHREVDQVREGSAWSSSPLACWQSPRSKAHGLLAVLLAGGAMVASGCSGAMGSSGKSDSRDDDDSSRDGDDGDLNDPSNLPPFDEIPQIPVGEEFACDRALSSAAPGQARRLTADEYANAVRDLFAVDIRAEALALPDARPTLRDFNNHSLVISSQHMLSFEKHADTITAKVDMKALVARHAPSCGSFSDDCQNRFIDNMGKLVLRGPVLDPERAAFHKVYQTAKDNSYSFEDASKFVLSSMLQAPRFLYRIEHETGDGGEVRLSPYMMASRLSFAIWQSTPDADLLEAADDDRLSSDADIGAQVDRMLDDPRALTAGVGFLDDWMDLHRLDDGEEIVNAFPGFNAELLKDMRAETRALFEAVLGERLPITTLLAFQKTKVSRRLAEHYGLPNPKDGVNEYDLDDVPERGGLLTQGSMASLGGPQGSTVQAGLHIMEEILCGHMASPPPGLNVTPTPPQPGESVRVSSETRTSNPACGACHEQFEPLVWGMVRYRATGEYRETDAFDNFLPEDGWIVFPDQAEEKFAYDSTADMMRLLAESTRVRDCALLKTAQYVQARSLRESDACYLDHARQALQPEASFQDIVKALALSPEFRRIRTVQP